MAVTKDDVVSFIDSMTVLEMSEFVKELEDKYGVTAAAPAVAVAAPAGGEAAAEEKTEFDVILTAAGDKKGLDMTFVSEENDYAIFMADYTTDPLDNFANLTIIPAY